MQLDASRLLLQAPPTEGEAAAVVIAVLVSLAVTVTVAILVYRDCRRRGAKPATWVTAWVALSLLGALGWALFALIYLTSRPKQILYDSQGNPLLPAVPPGSYQGAAPPPGWLQPSNAPGYESRWGSAPAPKSAPGWQPAPPPDRAPGWLPAPPPVAAPSPAGKPASKVKCPRCHTIFEYYPSGQGPTRVKCPACGEEGNI